MGLRKIRKIDEDMEMATKEGKESLLVTLAHWRDRAEFFRKKNEEYLREIEALRRELRAKQELGISQNPNQQKPVAL